MKRLWLVAALLAATVTAALGAGTINLSLSQQFDSQGKPLSGGKLYLFAAGTTTPQSAYTDTPLTIALPNPLTLDSSGRIPQFFLADGNIKVRLDDKNGVTVLAADNLLVIGPSAGGGGVASIDPTTVLTTGDMKVVYGTGALTGFVRANGRTIGSATSGATERANSDTNALFLYLYAADTHLTVSGGRGADAATDWAANKTIALPDWRGRTIAGLTDMGNTDTGGLVNSVTTLGPTVLGGSGGSELTSLTIAKANLPNTTFAVTGTDSGTVAGTFSGTITGVTSNLALLQWQGVSTATGAGNGAIQLTAGAANSNATVPFVANGTTASVSGTSTGTVTGTNSGTITGTAASGGSGTAIAQAKLSPTRLTTIYIKM